MNLNFMTSDSLFLNSQENSKSKKNFPTTTKPYSLESELIQSSDRDSWLNLIYLDNYVVLQVFNQEKPKEPIRAYKVPMKRELINRVKEAWECGAEDELIASALVLSDSLVVMGCDLKVWEVPMASIPCFERVPVEERANFEIDEDGSYLYWESADLHVDLEDFKAAVEPEFKEQLLMKKLEYGKSYGRAIAAVRKAHNLTQSEIEGITDRQIRRIEKEGQQPTLNALKKLAQAHGMDLEGYLAEVSKFFHEMNKEQLCR